MTSTDVTFTDAGDDHALDQPLVVTSSRTNVLLRWWHWAILISVGVIGPFSQDTYIPNMPKMTDELGTDEIMAGLTLQLNWISKGIANVGLGRISDQAGRRPIILATFCIYCAATIGCVLV